MRMFHILMLNDFVNDVVQNHLLDKDSVLVAIHALTELIELDPPNEAEYKRRQGILCRQLQDVVWYEEMTTNLSKLEGLDPVKKREKLEMLTYAIKMPVMRDSGELKSFFYLNGLGEKEINS